MTYARIIGSGSYLPPKIVTNDDLAKILDTSDNWIRTRTGIIKRHIACGETACDLAQKATIKALTAAKCKASELDLIVVATTTPDYIFPSTASLLQSRIGATCPAFDLQAVCAGFIYALSNAQQYIENGSANTILVVGSEVLSTIVDKNDRNTAVLFGDGAGAVVLRGDKQTGILHSKLKANGNYYSSLYVDKKSGFVHMQGNEVFKIAVQELSEIAGQTLAECPLDGPLDWMVPHQANIRIITAVAKRIKQPLDKVIITVSEHANTSAASIPLALDKGINDGRIKRGDSCLLEGIGAGFTWGSVLLRL